MRGLSPRHKPFHAIFFVQSERLFVQSERLSVLAAYCFFGRRNPYFLMR